MSSAGIQEATADTVWLVDVGYWWPSAVEWQPPTELVDFPAAGPPPVFVSLGSTVTTAHRAEQISVIVACALRRAGVRGIVQPGWAGLDVAGAGMLAIADVPYDWLFPRVAVVAHHCGAGTTAAGLRAGVPAVGLPNLGDQPFWAPSSRATGCQPNQHPAARSTPPSTTPSTDAAQRVARSIRNEDRAARVISTVEAVVGMP